MLRERIEERRGGDDEMPDLSHANRTIDALDFFGPWKLLDGLTDAGIDRYGSFMILTPAIPRKAACAGGSRFVTATSCG